MQWPRKTQQPEDSEGKTFGPSWLKTKLSDSLISAISSITHEATRKEVIAWFIQAREIMQTEGSKKQKSAELYKTLSSRRVAEMLGTTAKTTFQSYKGSGIPLSIKAALPVAAIGSVAFGGQGAGIAAFGSAIGLPVVLVLFLGTAGVTAVVEAFVKEKSVRDPLTRLLVAMLALERKRRASKDLLRTLREEVGTPQNQELSGDDDEELITQLRSLDPIDFERHIMALFEVDGYPVGVTPRTNDFGVDGFVAHPDGLIIVQCKRNSEANSVGRPVVQQFKGVVEEQNALRGYIVTTSRFTAGAKESAELSDKIILVDCDGLVRWHKDRVIPQKN